MAWETRGNGRYYYLARRIDGRVVKEYAPAIVAEWAAHDDQQQRELRAYERELWKQAVQEWQQTDRAIQEFLGEALRLSALLVQSAGYHRHHRGRWRKRRWTGDEYMGTTFVSKEDPARLIPDWIVPDSATERFSIVRSALEGNATPKRRAQAMAVLQSYPDTASTELSKDFNAVINRIIGESQVGCELAMIEAKRLRKELCDGRDWQTIPTAERWLIERVIACKFALADAERRLGGDMTLKQADYRQRAVDRAHRRYLSAIKALMEVRRLQLPVVAVTMPGGQVNVANQQINVSGQVLGG